MAESNAAELLVPYLAGLKFPADKDGALQAALQNGAPAEVLDLLEHLSLQRFVVPEDLLEAFAALRHAADKTHDA